MKLAFALILATLAVGGDAIAQPYPGADNLNRVCRADYDRYCPPYQGQRRGLAECIHDHLAQASPGCQAAVHARIRLLRAMAARDPRLRPAAEYEIGIFGGAPN